MAITTFVKIFVFSFLFFNNRIIFLAYSLTFPFNKKIFLKEEIYITCLLQVWIYLQRTFRFIHVLVIVVRLAYIRVYKCEYIFLMKVENILWCQRRVWQRITDTTFFWQHNCAHSLSDELAWVWFVR